MDRRRLLFASALTPLAACAGVSVSKVASDVDLIAQAVAAVLPTIQQLVGLKTALSDKIAAIVADIQATASAISSATSTDAVTLVSNLGSGIKSIVASLGGVSLPAWVNTVLLAAEALLPAIESAVGITPKTAAVFVAMTPAQARVILQAAATR